MAFADDSELPPDPWYAAHTFVASNGCVAIAKRQRLRVGDRVTLFQEGKPVRACRIFDVVNGDSAKQIFDGRGFYGVYNDKPLWNRVGCFWGLRAFDPELLALARYEDESEEDLKESLPLVVEGLPASALRVGGDGRPLTEGELSALQHRVNASMPKEFSHGKVLRAGRRYRPIHGNELIELFLGKPYYNTRDSGAPIDSIHIQHLFLCNGRALAFKGSSRVSGQEEHVDVEPPQLDESNWFIDAYSTLGFLSMDGGTSWDHLSRDDGFEGIHWMVSRLSRNMPLIWDLYLYTAH